MSAIVIDSCTGKSMEKLQDLGQSELQDLLDNSERVEVMALESDEVRYHRFQGFIIFPKCVSISDCIMVVCVQFLVCLMVLVMHTETYCFE